VPPKPDVEMMLYCIATNRSARMSCRPPSFVPPVSPPPLSAMLTDVSGALSDVSQPARVLRSTTNVTLDARPAMRTIIHSRVIGRIGSRQPPVRYCLKSSSTCHGDSPRRRIAMIGRIPSTPAQRTSTATEHSTASSATRHHPTRPGPCANRSLICSARRIDQHVTRQNNPSLINQNVACPTCESVAIDSTMNDAHPGETQRRQIQ
jgi:hypothetical protein